jgi:hypothetical protein
LFPGCSRVYHEHSHVLIKLKSAIKDAMGEIEPFPFLSDYQARYCWSYSTTVGTDEKPKIVEFKLIGNDLCQLTKHMKYVATFL